MDGSATPPNPPASLLERCCGAGRPVTRKNQPTPSDGLPCRSWHHLGGRRPTLPITLNEGGRTEGSQGNRASGSPPFLRKNEVGETALKAGFPAFSNGAKRPKNDFAKRPYKKEERAYT